MKDIIIIGAPRCGTTSLYNWMNEHPAICGSTPKEPVFFETEYHNGPEFFYKKYFPTLNETMHEQRLTARPQLSWVGFCAERVKAVSPNAHIIMMVRNPIERAYSGWKLIHDMRPGREPLDFPRFIYENYECLNHDKFNREENYVRYLDPKGGCYKPNVIEAGMYAHNVQRYLDIFDLVTIVDFHGLMEDKKVSKQENVRELLVLSGLNREQMRGFRFEEKEHLQEGNWFRPTITEKMDINAIKEKFPKTYSLLMDVYREDAIQLSEISGHDFAKDWGMR